MRELAVSIRECGQVQPITAWWTGEKYRVLVGFRRALAMCRFRDLGFETIRVTLAREGEGDLVRRAENLQRRAVSLYETSRYVYELRYGKAGRQCFSSNAIARAIGKTPRYVRMLIRWYRVLPPAIHDEWAADPERFSAERLIELAALAERGELRAPDDANGCPVEAAPSAGTKRRRLTRRRFRRLAEVLEEVGEAVLAESAQASTAHALLVAIANSEADEVEQIVRGLRDSLDPDAATTASPLTNSRSRRNVVARGATP